MQLMSELIPAEQRSAYSAASAAARAEIEAIKRELESDIDSTIEERALIKWMTRKSAEAGDNVGLTASLVGLADKLATSARISAAANNLLIHRAVIQRFLREEVVPLICDGFRDLCKGEDEFAERLAAIEQKLADAWSLVKNPETGDYEPRSNFSHGQHRSKLK